MLVGPTVWCRSMRRVGVSRPCVKKKKNERAWGCGFRHKSMLLVGYIAGNFRVFFTLCSHGWKFFLSHNFFFLSCVNDYTAPMATFTSWVKIYYFFIVKYFCRAGLGGISVQQRFFGSIYRYLEGICSDLWVILWSHSLLKCLLKKQITELMAYTLYIITGCPKPPWSSHCEIDVTVYSQSISL